MYDRKVDTGSNVLITSPGEKDQTYQTGTNTTLVPFDVILPQSPLVRTIARSGLY